MIAWEAVSFPQDWQIDIRPTLVNELRQPQPLDIHRIGDTSFQCHILLYDFLYKDFHQVHTLPHDFCTKLPTKVPFDAYLPA